MPIRPLQIRQGTAVAMTVLPVSVVALMRLFALWRHSGKAEALWPEAGYWGLAVLLAGLGAACAAWLRQRLLSQRAESMIDSYQLLALGETPPPRIMRANWDLLDRLDLSIQVMYSALADRLNHYRRFFQDAQDMFLTFIAAGGRVTEANQSFCRAVGLLESEVIGQPVERFVTLEKDWNFIVENPGRLLGGLLHTDKGERRIEASISVEGEPLDQLWILGMIVRDVEQREALHQALLTKSTALEKALGEVRSVEKLKDQFLTTLSHELKTPLVSLKGFLQLLQAGRGDPEQQAEYLAICARNLAKLEAQINNLLDLARLTHAKDQFEMRPVDLAEIVRTAAENLKALADQGKIAIDTSEVPEDRVMVRGNLEKLVQLVDNLLMNAVKYNVENGEIRLSLNTEDNNIVLKVADSGVGMAREEMAKIFNYFYRVEVGGTGRLEGLGIGLGLVQEIVRLHKGDIRVQSTPGVGTTFTVILAAA